MIKFTLNVGSGLDLTEWIFDFYRAFFPEMPPLVVMPLYVSGIRIRRLSKKCRRRSRAKIMRRHMYRKVATYVHPRCRSLLPPFSYTVPHPSSAASFLPRRGTRHDQWLLAPSGSTYGSTYKNRITFMNKLNSMENPNMKNNYLDCEEICLEKLTWINYEDLIEIIIIFI